MKARNRGKWNAMAKNPSVSTRVYFVLCTLVYFHKYCVCKLKFHLFSAIEVGTAFRPILMLPSTETTKRTLNFMASSRLQDFTKLLQNLEKLLYGTPFCASLLCVYPQEVGEDFADGFVDLLVIHAVNLCSQWGSWECEEVSVSDERERAVLYSR